MTGCRTLAVLPGGYVDQVARRAAFQKARPDAQISQSPGREWTGSLVVCRKRLEFTRSSLEKLLDRLEALAAVDAEALAIEQEFPAWRLWLSSVNRWWATLQGSAAAWIRAGIPITLSDDDLVGLRAQLTDARDAADAATAARGTR